MLGAPAVIVSEGGVGRPIDEIVLNAALFERHGVQVAGAIVNKVDLDAKPGLARTLERGLARHGIPLLGVLPYRPILSNPTLAMVLEGVHGETIHPGPDLDQVIGGVAIGAMEPEHMLERIGPRSLVIVPGDRSDVIRAIVGARTRRRRTTAIGALGLVLTGGYRPERRVLDAIRARRPVRHARPRGHLRGRLRAPRPAGQDPPGRRRQDRRDQGARSGSTCSSTGSSRWPRRRASTDGARRDDPRRHVAAAVTGRAPSDRGRGRSSASASMPAPIRPTPAATANSPRIPSAPATAPPPSEPRIVASPALAENRPWAVPPRPAGARAATTVTPPTNTQAKPEPFERGDEQERPPDRR